MKWTAEQEQAIYKEGTNIIVSAGAGSGKTAVLSERVLRKVKDGIDIRKILILTFTNEAAGEMKNRIRKKIKKAGILEQMEYIDSAYITTFDSFALSVVRKYHYILGISKNIGIIDSSIINLEKNRILEEIFLELYTKKDDKFLKLIGDFTNRDDVSIKEAILNINRSLDLKYDKISYLNTYLKSFYDDKNIERLFLEYFNYLKELAFDLESSVYALESMIDEELYVKVYNSYSGLFNPKGYDDLFKVKKIPLVQFRDVSEEVLPIKENIKNIVKEILELTVYSEKELKEQLLSTKDYVEAIIDILIKLDFRINEYKKKEEAFEFNDIAKMAIKIVMENDDIKEEFKSTYDEILIDEYQDTNDLQELFISNIANNNVYMVGDIKQSIYRFRNANPNIFRDKYDNYSKNIGGEAILLLKNFRSRREVLDNINEIFNLIMSDYAGGVDYKLNQAMIYGNMAYMENGVNNNDNNMEILKYESDGKYYNTEIEAFIILDDIKNKVKNKYQVYDFDLNSNRDVKFSDFCIILDRGSEMARYKKIFQYGNVSLDVYNDSNLVDEADIRLIKNITSLILLIKDKDYGTKMRYNFVSIARSYLSDLNDSEIFNYSTLNTFYESDIYKKCFKLAKDIDSLTPKMLLENIIEEFDIYENLIKVGNIEAAIFRLDYLQDIASNMEDLGFTIRDFEAYLDEMISGKKEIKYKEVRGIGNCVKIMNIHKSKGLEFPICYFAGFKKDFNLSDLKNKFMFSNIYGILTPFYKEGIGELFVKTLIKKSYYEEEISEKIRLFYVGLTRAKEKMIMVMPEFENAGYQKEVVPLEVSRKYRSFYDFMASIALNLKKYMHYVDIDRIPINKEYEQMLGNENSLKLNKSGEILFKENKIDSKLMDNLHASKVINKVLTWTDAKTLEFGTMMHERLELTDFKEKSCDKYVANLQSIFDFKNADIYQELEFMYNKDGNLYHGIIDLMLEYSDNIKIIDYKLKNIDDEAYIKQLNVYYDYIKSVSDKKISLYLYSIIDNKIKEIKLVGS